MQKILEENTAGKFFNKKKATRKLQNLIYCNCCERKRYIQIDGNETDYIKSCSYKISNNTCRDRGHKYLPVEDYVINKVKEKKVDFEKAIQKLKSLDTSDEENKLKNQVDSLGKQLEKFEKRQKNLTIMRADGEISKSDFLVMSEENERQIKQVKQQLELVDIQIKNLKNTEKEQRRLEKIIGVIDRIEMLDPEECNAFLKTFIKKIWFSTNAIANHNTKTEVPEVTIEIEWL